MSRFTIAEDGEGWPRFFYDKLLSLPEFEHLVVGDAKVVFLMRHFPDSQAGRSIIGSCKIPAVQGRNRHLFDWMIEEMIGPDIDFVFEMDAEWWREATYRKREILTYHEMCHAGQAKGLFGVPRFHRETGKPVWCITPHDVEEFTAVVSRYGAWDEDIRAFVAAANQSSRFNHE